MHIQCVPVLPWGSGLVAFSLVKQLGGKTKCAVTWLYISGVPVFHQARARVLEWMVFLIGATNACGVFKLLHSYLSSKESDRHLHVR
jgi:hypothetical protein